MFLLIPFRNSSATIVVDTLNSIMFLLIPEQTLCSGQCLKSFKFHYVSINSILCIWIFLHWFYFKFHYVSINSHHPCEPSHACKPLNSIMFLLIRWCAGLPSPRRFSLNSIMFLLIRYRSVCWWMPLHSFKFHYVSINSIQQIALRLFIFIFKFHYVSINSVCKSYIL